MKIGVPKEIKNHEYRVGLTPIGVYELVKAGNTVFVETNAGEGIGLTDEAYQKAGATIIKTAEEIFQSSQMIVKVKEPLKQERQWLHKDQTLFTYLHLASSKEITEELIESGVTAIAYETVVDKIGGLPLLKPMSIIAGRMSIQVAAHCLEKEQGGKGVLVSGATGVPPANVVILGAGNVGYNAAITAAGMGANVTVLDNYQNALENIDKNYTPRMASRYASTINIEHVIQKADCIIGAALITGEQAPKLITKAMLTHMEKGTVLVDVAIDQGGCFETSRPTTHQEPTYIVNGIVHYAVSNMPGAVAQTATWALTSATLPYILQLSHGIEQTLTTNEGLRKGLNIHRGYITHEGVASTFRKHYTPFEKLPWN